MGVILFLSSETLTLDFIQFFQDIKVFFKRIFYWGFLFFSIPFLIFGLPEIIDLFQTIIVVIQEQHHACVVRWFEFLETLVHIFLKRDGPSFFYWAGIIIYLENKMVHSPREFSIEGDEYLARRILLRDRLFAFFGYYIFSQQFYFNFGILYDLYELKYEIPIFGMVRKWVTFHWTIITYLNLRWPLAINFIILVGYRQVVRRRNAYDTIWLDRLKLFEWHALPIAPLKHFVRYNFAMSWFLESFSSVIFEVFQIFAFIFTQDTAFIFRNFLIQFLYYAGSIGYIVGATCALLGLRPWFPFMHRPIVNNVGLYNPPGDNGTGYDCQPKDFDGGDAFDDDNPYYKFRF